MEKDKWFKANGTIIYDPKRPQGMSRGTDWWCIITADREITRYYRYWVDKHVLNPLAFDKGGLCQPSFDAHISIIRGWNDARHNIDEVKKLWKKYHGQKVEYLYHHNVRQSGDTTGWDRPNSYWFIEVQCAWVKTIREEMGLITTFKPHMTIGRTY